MWQGGSLTLTFFFDKTILVAGWSTYLDNYLKLNFDFLDLSSSTGGRRTLLIDVVGPIAISHISLHKWKELSLFRVRDLTFILIPTPKTRLYRSGASHYVSTLQVVKIQDSVCIPAY